MTGGLGSLENTSAIMKEKGGEGGRRERKKGTNEASAAKFENTEPAHYTSLSTSAYLNFHSRA